MIAGGIKNKQCSYIGGCLQTFSLSFSTLSLSTFRKREREREHGKAVGKKGIGLIGMIRISLSPTVAHRKGSTERTTRRSINATLIRYRDQTNGRVQIPQKICVKIQYFFEDISGYIFFFITLPIVLPFCFLDLLSRGGHGSNFYDPIDDLEHAEDAHSREQAQGAT